MAAGRVFGQTLDLSLLLQPHQQRQQQGQQPQQYTPDTLIPGVAVYSRRADPLAAWTAGLELAGLSADTDRAGLILDTGVNQRWRYGSYRRSPETTAEAEAWEVAKRAAG